MPESQSKSFSYKLLPQSSIHQNCSSRAMAINKSKTLLLVQKESFIKCFAFKRGEIKLLQLFHFGNATVNTLNFQMQKQNIISGSDKFICKYSSNLMANPKYIQKCFGQFNTMCLILHPLKEDIIIIGSKIGPIHFLFTNQIGSNKPFTQTIQEHNNVLGLSINDQGTRIISCGKDNFLLIIEPNQSNSELQKCNWIVKQRLIVEQYGYRICFINNNQFTFQPSNNSYINYYCEINGMFYKQSQHQIPSNKQDSFCIFQQVYNQQKSLIFNIYGRVLQIIKFSKEKSLNSDQTDQLFQLEQLIDFGERYNPWIYGIISEDAEYIITWDFDSEQIQIRQFQNNQ
ncbi:unnamed protein product [Paramecium pentaurelia]|uniref:WD40-repeat-containing domain n=1 Tax=Paramecium pentaurelia TaxID=43138 RepID=A0A8S1SAE8_9CILI|nr:unnamed protein product [Paramecium pentaurelia]